MKLLILLFLVGLLSSCSSIQTNSNSVARNLASGAITQQALMDLINEKQPQFRRYSKKAIILIKAPSRFSDLPEALLKHLGGIDKVNKSSYEKKWDEKGYGDGYIALQMVDGKFDFYPMSERAFSKYKEVDRRVIKNENNELYAKLLTNDNNQDAQSIRAILQEDRDNVLFAKKKGTTSMCKVSDLGFSSGTLFVIESPWGGTQEKTNSRDAYIVSGDGKAYMVNAEISGLPIAYRLVD